MRIEKLNNTSHRSFSSSLDVENFQNSPTLNNFKYLNQSEKLDALFLMLDKQDKKLNDLQSEHILIVGNQQKMHNFNANFAMLSAEKDRTTNLISHDYRTNKLDVLG